jgi:hypothetical protein
VRASRRLRIVLVSQYFPPEIGATQSRMQSFAEHLADRGHRVTVIAEFPNHPHGVMPSEYRGRLVEDDRSNAYRVLRVWVKTNEEKTQMTRLEFYVSFMALATAAALHRDRGAGDSAPEPCAVRARRSRSLAGGRDEPPPDLRGLVDARGGGGRA